jgi:hypothetical protein
MTVTIALSPEAEARLRRRAAQQGQPINELAAAMLEQALTVDPDDLPTKPQPRSGPASGSDRSAGDLRLRRAYVEADLATLRELDRR